MRRRKKMSRKSSRRSFKKYAGHHPKNNASRMQRGGIRL